MNGCLLRQIEKYQKKEIVIFLLRSKISFLFLSLILCASPAELYAALYYSQGDGAFSSLTNWDTNAGGGGSDPAFGDLTSGLHTFIIQDGDSVILDTNVFVAVLTIGQGTSGKLMLGDDGDADTLVCAGTFTVAIGAQLKAASVIVSSLLELQGNLVNNGTIDLKFGTGRDATLVFNNGSPVNISGAPSQTQISKLIFDGTASVTASIALDVEGDLSIESGATFDDGGQTHTLAGSWAKNRGTYTATGTLVMDASGSQAIDTVTTFNNLTFSGGSGGKQINGAITVNGAFLVDNNTTVSSGNYRITFNGTFNVTSGSTFTMNTATGIADFNSGSPQTITLGGTVTFYRVEFDNSTKDITGNLNVIDLTSVFADAIVTGAGDHVLEGLRLDGYCKWSGTITFQTTVGTYNVYNSNADTIILGTADVIIDNSGTLGWETRLNGGGTDTMRVNGHFTISSGSFTSFNGTFLEGTGSKTLTVSNGARLWMRGADNFPTGFGTYTLAPTSIALYQNLANQTIRGGITYGELELNTAGTKTVDGVLDIDGVLDLNGGVTLDLLALDHTIAGDILNGTNSSIVTSAGGGLTFDAADADQDIATCGTGSYVMQNVFFTNTAPTAVRTKNIDSDMIIQGDFTVTNAGGSASLYLVVDPDANVITNANDGGDNFSIGPHVHWYTSGLSSLDSLATFNSVTLDSLSIVRFDGTNQNIPAFTYGSIYLQNNGDKTLQGDITIRRMLSYQANTPVLYDGGNTITIQGNWDLVGSSTTAASMSGITKFTGGNQNISVSAFERIIVAGSGTKTLLGDIDVDDSLRVNANATLTCGNYDLTIAGHFFVNDDGVYTQNYGVTGGTYGITTFDGAGGQTIDFNDNSWFGDFTVSNTAFQTITVNDDLNINRSLTLNNNTGILNISGDSIFIGRDFTYGTGTAILTTTAASVMIFDGSTDQDIYNSKPGIFPNLKFTGAGEKRFNSNNYDINGDFTVVGSTVDGLARTLNVSGNWSNTGTFQSTATVIFDGGALQTVSASYFYHVTIANTADTVKLTGNWSVGGNLTINAGAILDANPTGNYNISVENYWYNNNGGEFHCRQGTVTYVGNYSRIYSGGVGTGFAFYNLVHNSTLGQRTDLYDDIEIRGDFSTVDGGGQFYTGAWDMYVAGGFDNQGDFNCDVDNQYIYFNGTSGTHDFNPGAELNFRKIQVTGAATYRLTGDLEFDNDNNGEFLQVTAGVFDLNGHSVTHTRAANNADVIVDGGTLEIDSGAVIVFANNNDFLVSAGTLKIVGAADGVASIRGTTTGYDFDVTGGTVHAQYYLIEDTQGPGIDFTGGAVDPTDNFSNGTFSSGTGTFYLSFAGAFNLNDDTAANVVFNSGPSGNVNRANGASTTTITFEDAFGGLAGVAYESDGQNEVEWIYPNGVYWDGGQPGSISWHAPNNWSSNTVPTSADKVYLDHSLLAGAFSVTLDSLADAVCNRLIIDDGGSGNIDLTMNGYDLVIYNNFSLNNAGSSLIMSAATDTLKVWGNWSNSGTFTDGGAVVLFGDTTGGSRTITPGGTGEGSDFHHVVVNAKGSTYNLGGTMNIDGSVNILDGTLSAGSNNITVYDDWTVSGDGVFSSAGTVTFDGISDTVQVVSGGTFFNFTANGTGTDTVRLASNITVQGDVTLSAGTVLDGKTYTIYVGDDWINNVGAAAFVQTGTGTVNFNGTSGDNRIQTNTTDFNNLVFSGTTLKHFLVNTNINGDFSINSGLARVENNGYTITGVGGSNTLTQNGSDFWIEATGDNFPTGFETVDLVGGRVIYRCNCDQDVSAQTYYNLDVDYNGGGNITKTLLGDITVQNDLRVLDIQTTFDVDGYTIEITQVDGGGGTDFSVVNTGNVDWKDGKFIHSGDAFSFDAQMTSLHDLVLSGSGTKTMTTDMTTTGDVTIQNGALLDMNTYVLDATVDSTQAFTIAAGSSLYTAVVDPDNAFPGDYDTYSLSATSTVRYDGANNQTLFTGCTYGNLETNLTAGRTIQLDGNNDLDVNGNFTCYDNDYTFDDNGFDIYIEGDIDFRDTYVPTVGTTVYMDGADQTLVETEDNVVQFENLVFTGSGTKTNTSEQWNVDGTIVIDSNVVVNTNQAFYFAGADWTVHDSATFQHTNNYVYFDGDNTQTIDWGPSSYVAGISFTGNGGDVDTVIFSGHGIDVDEVNNAYDFTIGANSYVDMGALTHYISSDEVLNGGTWVTTNAALIFDRNDGTQQDICALSTASNITVEGAGTKLMTGDWTMIDDLTINSGATLDANNTGNYNITLQGNWTCAGAFTSRAGDVYFESDDGTAKTITTAASSFYNVWFNQTYTNARTYSLQDDATLNLDMSIGNGATLDLNGNTLTMGTNDADVEDITVEAGGTLEVDANATLAYETSDGDANLTVNGTLRVVGASGNAATVTRTTGANRINIDITGVSSGIEAKYYHFEYLVDSGLTVSAASAVHATNNFSNGTWSNMNTGSAKARYLELEADLNGLADSIRDVTFNFSGTPTQGNHYNVRRTATTDSIDFAGDVGGTLGSYAYEEGDDQAATGKVTWPPTSSVTWEGTAGINWHNPANWNPNTVPTASISAVIPNKTNDPVIFTGSAICKSLNISNGVLALEQPLTVVNSLTLGDGTAGVLEQAADSAIISIGGDLTINNNASYVHGGSKLKFTGAGGGTIAPNTQTIGKLEITGASTYLLSGVSINVADSLIVSSVSQLKPNTNNYVLTLEGHLACSGTLDNSTVGTTVVSGANQNLTGGKFYNLTIQGSGTTSTTNAMSVANNCTIDSSLTAGAAIAFGTLGGNQDVTIAAAGTFNDGGYNHTTSGRYWYGTGTYAGSGSVSFNRNGVQDIYGGNFHNLVLTAQSAGNYDKYLYGNITVAGDLTLEEEMRYFYPQTYTTTGTGTGKTFTMEAGLRVYCRGADNFPSDFDSWSLEASSITYYDAAFNQTIRSAQYGNLIIDNATTKTLEGNIDVDGYLTFNEATLDASASHYNIKLAGNWNNNAEGSFVARNGTVEFDGNGVTQTVNNDLVGTKSFYNLKVSGSSNTVQVNTQDIVIANNLTVSSGTFNANNRKITVGRNLINTGGTLSTSGEYELTYASDTAYIQSNGSSLNDMTINGDSATYFKLLDDLDVNNTFTVTDGIFYGNGKIVQLGANTDVVSISGSYIVGAGGELQLENNTSLTVNSGGIFELVGSASEEAVLTRVSAGYYNFTCNGTIKAKYYRVEYVNTGGVYVTSTGSIDNTYRFQEGTFTNGANGGTFLRVENTQSFTGGSRIENVSFPTTIAAGGSNVKKSIAVSGDLEFYNATGSFAGESKDNDPNDLIDWTGPVTITWKATAASGDWFSKTNWTVSSGPDTIPYPDADVVIQSATNPPVITTSGAWCQNLLIEASASLTLTTLAEMDSDLVVYGDVTIASGGALTISSANDTMHVKGNWSKVGSFTHGNGTVVFEPSSGTKTVDNGATNFYNVLIGGSGSAQLAANTKVANDFEVSTGATFNFDTRDLTVGGGFVNGGTIGIGTGGLTLNSTDAVTETFNPGSASFNDLTISGGASTVYQLTANDLTVNGNLNITGGKLEIPNGFTYNHGNGAGDVINIANGTLEVDENAYLKMSASSSVSVNSGGIIKFVGTSGSNVSTLTRQSSGTYTFEVNSGGTIHARYYLMEYMNASGIQVKSGATVNTTNNFSDGTFSNGASGGRYLWLEATLGAIDTVENVRFNTGPTYNVKRSGSDTVTFKDPVGLKAGFLHEQDDGTANDGRLRWYYTYEIATWNGSNSTAWDSIANWDCVSGPCGIYPNDANWAVIIPNCGPLPNSPQLLSAEDTVVLKSLSIQNGGSLTIKDGHVLTKVIASVTISTSGTLTVENGATSEIRVFDQWENSGTFNCGDASTVRLKAGSGTKTITVGGDAFYNLIIDSTATQQVSSTIVVNNNLIVNAGTFSIPSAAYSLTVKGDLQVAGSATFNNSATNSTFNNPGDQNIAGGAFTNLVLDGSGTKTLTDSITVNGDLDIDAGVKLDLGSFKLTLTGDLDMEGVTDPIIPGMGRIVFSGTSPQQILASDDVEFYSVTFNNSASDVLKPQITCDEPITVNAGGTLGFVDGVVKFVTAADTMVVGDNVTLAGGTTAASYLSGIMKKAGDDDWIFPIGTDDYFARTGITFGPGKTGAAELSVKYYDTAYYSTSSKGWGVARVSTVEHWDVHRVTGGAGDSVRVTHYWADTARSGITNPATLLIAHLDGDSGKWVDMGNAAWGASGTSCWVTSDRYYKSFSGSGGGGDDDENPLPVELLAFTAEAAEGYVQTNWATAAEMNNDYFTVEKTRDARTYEVVGEVSGRGNSVHLSTYVLTDYEPYPGTSYYRLKQTDFDGKYRYSDLVSVHYQKKEASSLSVEIYPNPVSYGQTAYLRVNGLKDINDIRVSVKGVMGRQLFSKNIEVFGVSQITWPLDPFMRLAPGTYQVIINSMGKKKTCRYVVK